MPSMISCSNWKLSHIMQKAKYDWNTLLCTGITSRPILKKKMLLKIPD